MHLSDLQKNEEAYRAVIMSDNIKPSRFYKGYV